MNAKITPDHLGRSAVVYVRQSTMSQVMGNLESQRRQYDLAGTAQTAGFLAVTVIDDDLGHDRDPREDPPVADLAKSRSSRESRMTPLQNHHGGRLWTNGSAKTASGRALRPAGTPGVERAKLLHDPAVPLVAELMGGAALTASCTALPAHAALNELARLLGRRAARRHRQSLGVGQLGLAPVLFLAALALGAFMLSMRLMQGH